MIIVMALGYITCVLLAFKVIKIKVTPGAVATAVAKLKVQEGQIPPEANLPIAANLGSKGYLAVKIEMDDAELAKELPLGAAGTTAIYTDFGGPFHIITLITVRIKAWMNYVPS